MNARLVQERMQMVEQKVALMAQQKERLEQLQQQNQQKPKPRYRFEINNLRNGQNVLAIKIILYKGRRRGGDLLEM